MLPVSFVEVTFLDDFSLNGSFSRRIASIILVKKNCLEKRNIIEKTQLLKIDYLSVKCIMFPNKTSELSKIFFEFIIYFPMDTLY